MYLRRRATLTEGMAMFDTLTNLPNQAGEKYAGENVRGACLRVR